MYRKFNLVNGNGETYGLNGLDIFASNPAGLGVAISNSYYVNGTDFINDNSSLALPVFKTKVVFGIENGDAYLQYQKFVAFLNATPLRLDYSHELIGSYSRDMKLAELTKSETTLYGVLEEDLTLECVGAWYSWKSGATNIYDEQAGDGKIYLNTNMSNNLGHYIFGPLSLEGTTYETPFIGWTDTHSYSGYIYGDVTNPAFAYVEDFGYTETLSWFQKFLYNKNNADLKDTLPGYVYEEDFIKPRNFFAITNDSVYLDTSDGAPLEITIKATTESIFNPSWELRQGGEVLQTDRYFVEIPAGYSLVVSSDPQNQRVELLSNTGEVSNIYQSGAQDMTKTNFIRVPVGRYTLAFDTPDSAHISYELKKENVVV
jgi:hypothetical protein